MRQFMFCMEIEAGTLHGGRVSNYTNTNSNKAVFTVRPVWVTNGRRFAVISMLGSSLRMLQLGLGMDGRCRSTEQGGLSDFVSHTMSFLVSFYVHIIRARPGQLLSFVRHTDVCSISLSGVLFPCEEHHVVDFVSHTYLRQHASCPQGEPLSAGRVRVHTCCECCNKRGYIRTWYVYQNFFFHFQFDEIYRHQLFFTLGSSVFFVNRLFHN